MEEYICPNCKRPIYDQEALLCHFCGESLERSSQGFLGKMKYSPARWGWTIVIGVLVIMFLLLMLK